MIQQVIHETLLQLTEIKSFFIENSLHKDFMQQTFSFFLV